MIDSSDLNPMDMPSIPMVRSNEYIGVVVIVVQLLIKDAILGRVFVEH